MKNLKLYYVATFVALFFVVILFALMFPRSNQISLENPTVNIVLNGPVSSPVLIEGSIPRSWTFEASFPIEITDDTGKTINTVPVAVNFPDDSSISGAFSVSIPFSTTSKNGYIIIHNDNPSGLPENDKSFKIPVNFLVTNSKDTMKVKIYQAPKDVSQSCESVDYVEVDIPKSSTPLKDSLEYLISHLNNTKGFKLVSAVINSGVAILKFDDPNFYSTGGSCHVSSLSSQIEKTALQFPTVKSVKFIGPEHLFQP